MIAIGKTITINQPIHDFSGQLHAPGTKLVVEKAANVNTEHPIVMATPVDWTRHAITHETLHSINVDQAYCFYVEDLRKVTE